MERTLNICPTSENVYCIAIMVDIFVCKNNNLNCEQFLTKV